MKKVPDMNGGGDFNPSAILKETNAMIEGVLESVRQVKTQYGEKPVYTMRVQEYTCRFVKGDKVMEPTENSKVDFFAPTRLNRQLENLGFGKLVRITYAGQKKVGKGNPAHIFDVLVEE